MRRLGYLPGVNLVTVVEPLGEAWAAWGNRTRLYRFCANAEYDCCNWLVDADSREIFCAACRHNATIPDLSHETNVALWRKIELAKHRLFYSLLRFHLPLQTRNESAVGLAFDFPADGASPNGPMSMTGHEDGRITIMLAEADDAEREKRRSAMHEPYRTILGHFRHEIGHYYWDRLVRDENVVGACRAIFGDDRIDYPEALRIHYEQGAPDNWQESFVSAYATSHPWEDFAETWAHYFHIVDTLEMAHAFGVGIHPLLDASDKLESHIDFQPYGAENITRLVDAWLPLTFALNSINRCMGQADLYPFILTPAIVEKLGFIHKLIRDAGSEKRSPARADHAERLSA
jgi:hypothetical protein